ncbi:MAG: 3-hydroxyacyl-CoA dehydrogenase/enoyl-CoA hydratase family protein [Acidobacteria bacterium]|nr:MAG: 3-hydroxyacyl-CoA dehydrogenase/enoyl-CoA hydratase family protein [Acidobacteriota bacterium]
MSPIERVAVLGAGTMGAAIAAHAANAGLRVLLLDVVPGELLPEEEEKGLSLEHPEVRNRIVRRGFERIKKLKPPAFMSAAAERLVELGNLEDDLGRLHDADWIVEAVIEDLEVKRRLLARVETVRQPGSIVTTNTSGLPIARLVAGRGDDFRRAFFGTHFFNPPRYMKLLELIAGDDSDPRAVAALRDLAERRLGKGVVRAKDSPNFIANRILSVHGAFIAAYALERGYAVEEVDAVTGPLIGRPKTATFRLQDLVGIDVTHHVARNLYRLIPDDPHREVLAEPRLTEVVGTLLERGSLGNKTGRGFYRRRRDDDGRTVYDVIDLESFDYRPARPVRFPSLAAVAGIRDLGRRLKTLFAEEHRDDRGAQLAWAAVAHLLAYAASCAPQVAYDLPSVDRAVRWGFGYQAGPFELWDLLGVEATRARLEEDGYAVADWVEEMLAAGCDAFYRRRDGQLAGCYDLERRSYVEIERDPRRIRAAELRARGRELDRNPGASLCDLGDGVLLLDSRRRALDGDVIAMLERARARLEDDAHVGLVIARGEGKDFCLGANLRSMLGALEQGHTEAIGAAGAWLQNALIALRDAPKPVVAAVHGMALGGGCEIALGVDRAVLAAESYLGLVEAGVGLLPAGGGLKELVRRLLVPAMQTAENDPLPAARRILELAATARVSSSAAEAREMGFLGPQDRIVMNRDHLLHEARREVLQMVADGYAPPPPAPLYAGGRDLYAALKIAVWSLEQAGYASAHDALIGDRIAYVVAGGDLSAPRWVDESWFLTLERRAFLELIQTDKTQARIQHMLATGKALRN